MAANLQSMCQYWKNFNLTELQGELEISAAELINRQDESDIARRQLVELSREFKKNTPEDIRKSVAPLLKSFQGEIDSLSKRSKNAEAAFLSVYKKFIDVPDPLPLLEHAQDLSKRVQKLQNCEFENTKLRETLDEYNKEFSEIKNQEVTIKQLKEKIKDYEEKIDITAETKAKEKEFELQNYFTEKEKQLQESQLNIAKKLGEAELKISTLQKSLEEAQSEFFDLKSKYDEATSAKSDEMDMIMADLDRANEKAAATERDNGLLKAQLESVSEEMTKLMDKNQNISTRDMAEDLIRRSNMEVELSTKDNEIAQLVEDVQRLQATVAKLRETEAANVAKLEEELSSKNKAFSILENRLQSQLDYEEIKRELSILKSMEFGSQTESEESYKASAESHGKTLEILLLEKNKQLQSECTQMKIMNTDLSSRCSKLDEENSKATSLIQEQKQLITQLEDDLRKVNAVSSMFRGDAEGIEAASMVESTDGDDAKLDVPYSSTVDMKSAADSLLPIVQSQRERFRDRAHELEMEMMTQQRQIQIIQNEADSMRKDNVKLYEKIKFLQGFPGKTQNELDDGTETRYALQYEKKLDPFASFNKKERQRKYMNLKPYDKITLSMGKAILGNKIARGFMFFYTILMHMLVFLVLYKMAYTESCKRDFATECHDRFAQHMKDVHGEHHM